MSLETNQNNERGKGHHGYYKPQEVAHTINNFQEHVERSLKQTILSLENED